METSNWKIIGQLCAILWLICSCSGNEKSHQSASHSDHAQIPVDVTQAIEKEFAGAMPYAVGVDTLLQKLLRFGITPDQILWGQSICVDDITNTKNKLIHPEIKGPFTFGGLGGLPFTGITGVNAFAHHIPEEGTAVLFVGPHIGYHSGEGWGKILRHGQHHTSSCCGALHAALDKLQKDEIKTGTPSKDDYQEQIIEQLALVHQKEILSAADPLVALTKVVAKEAEQKMTEYAQKVRERHFKFAVIVVGVIINTDYQFDDYLWIDHVSVKNIEKNTWVEQP
jgi:hypothetical protein